VRYGSCASWAALLFRRRWLRDGWRTSKKRELNLANHVYSASGAGNETSTNLKKGLDKAANTRRADIEGKAGKEERDSEPTCAELISDGADEAVDLFEAEDAWC
jgi:hypothetical protein